MGPVVASATHTAGKGALSQTSDIMTLPLTDPFTCIKCLMF